MSLFLNLANIGILDKDLKKEMEVLINTKLKMKCSSMPVPGSSFTSLCSVLGSHRRWHTTDSFALVLRRFSTCQNSPKNRINPSRSFALKSLREDIARMYSYGNSYLLITFHYSPKFPVDNSTWCESVCFHYHSVTPNICTRNCAKHLTHTQRHFIFILQVWK